MTRSILSQVNELNSMTMSQLKHQWFEVFGEKTFQRHRKYLIKRLARKLQEDQWPKLTPEDEAKVAEYRDLIRQLPPDRWFPSKWRGKPRVKVPATDNRTPPPGSVITRQYHGQEIVVKVLDDAFEYEGQVYRSLSAVAKFITGTTWNGPAFFGLRKRGQS